MDSYRGYSIFHVALYFYVISKFFINDINRVEVDVINVSSNPIKVYVFREGKVSYIFEQNITRRNEPTDFPSGI